MIQWTHSEERLNRYAGHLPGERLSFLVHYWGSVRNLATNAMHKHSFLEICYVDNGEGIYTEAGVDFPLRQGTAFCSRPDIYHRIQNVDQLDLLFVAFEVRNHPAEDHAMNYLRVLEGGPIWIEDAREAPSIHLWKSLLIHEQPGQSLPVTLLPPLAHALLESFSIMFGKKDTLPKGPEISTGFSHSAQLVQRAKLYIRDNLGHQQLSLSEVARFLNISHRQLSRLFATCIHESFSSFVRTERIRAAELMLTNSDEPIKLIAERTGFSSVHYFTRLFTMTKGVPPAAYRAKFKAVLAARTE